MNFNVYIKKINLVDKSGTRTVLRNLHFALEPGKVYTILGKNGSGKSTLIKSLTMLLDKIVYHTEGTVFWNGENILSMNEERLLKLRQKEIRYVLQDLTNSFDPLKKLEYYFDNSGIDEKIISEKLKSFLLSDYNIISRLHSYEISGGMAQRLSLLIALLPGPNLLILDEPTSAIDYTNINLVKLKLKEFISSGNCSLIVTQDISFAKEVSDEIAFLKNGTLTKFKPVDVFFDDDNDIYSDFLKSYKELK